MDKLFPRWIPPTQVWNHLFKTARHNVDNPKLQYSVLPASWKLFNFHRVTSFCVLCDNSRGWYISSTSGYPNNFHGAICCTITFTLCTFVLMRVQQTIQTKEDITVFSGTVCVEIYYPLKLWQFAHQNKRSTFLLHCGINLEIEDMRGDRALWALYSSY